jgi:hypothetical protein
MRIVTKEIEDEGLIALLGEKVELYCSNYIYAGELEGVNDNCVKLKNAVIVYETGAHNDAKYKDAQSVGTRYVMLHAIESFAATKRL